MIVNLTQKERTLLEDQKSHEEICIEKYTNYANRTSCPELKNLFQNHAKNEQTHLDSINQLLNGQLPNTNSQSGGQGGQSQSGQGGQSGQNPSMGGMQNQSTQGGQSGQSSSMGGMQGQGTQGGQSGQGSSMGGMQGQGGQNSQNTEKYLCTDLLMTEKYVSGTYDTAIFEFTDPQVRDVLNHIQKEEQQHGESIFKYMESKGLYQAQ